jgi:hypothetical protein
MTVDEPATADFGEQETLVFVAFVVTSRLNVPEDAGLYLSPP